MNIRKKLILRETIETDETGTPCAPVTRVAAMAVVNNPLAGQFGEDLSDLFDIGGRVGELLMKDAMAVLPLVAVSYGKGAIVGVNGCVEHGGAMVHPKLGKPMRYGVGGGKAVIPSNVKVGSPGISLDVPVGHKDDVWSFSHFDTMTIMVPDAPRPSEIVVCLVITDGGRPHPRVGDGPITD